MFFYFSDLCLFVLLNFSIGSVQILEIKEKRMTKWTVISNMCIDLIGLDLVYAISSVLSFVFWICITRIPLKPDNNPKIEFSLITGILWLFQKGELILKWESRMTNVLFLNHWFLFPLDDSRANRVVESWRFFVYLLNALKLSRK